MTHPAPETQPAAERRLQLDRRSGADRRDVLPGAQIIERRVDERRGFSDRRAGVERRLSIQSAEDQIRGAMKLLGQLAETGTLSDLERRELDAAILRLRFAMERLSSGAG